MIIFNEGGIYPLPYILSNKFFQQILFMEKLGRGVNTFLLQKLNLYVEIYMCFRILV